MCGEIDIADCKCLLSEMIKARTTEPVNNKVEN